MGQAKRPLFSVRKPGNAPRGLPPASPGGMHGRPQAAPSGLGRAETRLSPVRTRPVRYAAARRGQDSPLGSGGDVSGSGVLFGSEEPAGRIFILTFAPGAPAFRRAP